ncbi:hypothetical protein FDG95_gp475 [Pectobacterium phage vB_PcaM_CBB]|uniref:Uncharacterized protein n=1 Tax=Pectobacterium phage vB_PcaM_CBB TaxID=2772511 RepID=A0A1L2CVP4_9CAUD|nr:hypothetical protein FDG95_gp475 [Pectobacterium phage vB_PcaM_CBB]AMM44067.1 hypothetical protein CBB_504 [Pectobacterium phage vB_PcaM_CBB]
MNKSNIETLIYNLSAVKYQFAIVCETALDQLSHYFCTIGNAINYDPVRGMIDCDRSGNYFCIIENHIFSFDDIQAQRKKSCEELEVQYNRLKEIFGDEVPENMKRLYVDEIEKLKKPFEVLDESYFFSYNDIAREMIDAVQKRFEEDRHLRLQINTPVIDEQCSIIFKVKNTDNPLIVKLAITTCKAWIEVLEYYVQAEWYFTEEEIQKYQGASHYFSLSYINTCIDKFKQIVENLENQNA